MGAFLASIELKVKASTAAALVAGVLVWLLSRYVFKGTVPAEIVAIVDAAVPAAFAAVAGYLAPHAARASDPAPRHAAPHA